MASLKDQAFVGCLKHSDFVYNCQACLISTVGKLCELLDEKLTRRRTIQFSVGFSNSEGYHLHVVEEGETPEGLRIRRTVSTDDCPTCKGE